jgi:ribosomal protein L16/L10AE
MNFFLKMKLKRHRFKTLKQYGYKWSLIKQYSIGIKPFKNNQITREQKSAILRYLTKKLKKRYVFISKLHYMQLSKKKTLGTRMGQGSGKNNTQMFFVNKTRCIVECYGTNNKYAISILKRLQYKTNIKLKIKQRIIFKKY